MWKEWGWCGYRSKLNLTWVTKITRVTQSSLDLVAVVTFEREGKKYWGVFSRIPDTVTEVFSPVIRRWPQIPKVPWQIRSSHQMCSHSDNNLTNAATFGCLGENSGNAHKKTFPGLLQRLFGFHLGGYCRNTVTCAKRFQLKGYMCDYNLSWKTLHTNAKSYLINYESYSRNDMLNQVKLMHINWSCPWYNSICFDCVWKYMTIDK